MRERILIIGELQGLRKHIAHDVVHDAIKVAHGLFPKRLLMETVFILAPLCEVERIVAVGDKTHVFRSLRYRHGKEECFFASYSEFWLSLGGVERSACR